MDGNYSTSQNIEGLADLGITLYSPVKQPAKDLAKDKPLRPANIAAIALLGSRPSELE